jgi:hypothetical protein
MSSSGLWHGEGFSMQTPRETIERVTWLLHMKPKILHGIDAGSTIRGGGL